MTAPSPWLAPYRDTPVDGAILVPGSKSLTNRALILAALGDDSTVLSRPLASRDTNLMASALTALGARIERDGSIWRVTPSKFDEADVTIDCGLAGTVMRFVPPVATLSTSDIRFDGDANARVRPMSTIIAALRDLGANIDDDERGTLPFVLHATGGLPGGTVNVDASASSQFVSALLLTGARYARGIDIIHTGPSVPSLPHIEMTIAQLRLRGVDVDDTTRDRWTVAPGPIAARDMEIEPDLSNAGPFIAGAIATGGCARIHNWPYSTDQPGDQWRTIAQSFGARVERDADDMVFTAGPTIAGVRLDLHEVGELSPVISALAALANDPSRLVGIAHLRGHETDRLAALATEFNALGIHVNELDDGLEIAPGPRHGGVFHTYHDHRMAHAGVVLGLRTPEVQVENIETTAKTYPDFAAAWGRFTG